jgi:hypothetical protein
MLFSEASVSAKNALPGWFQVFTLASDFLSLAGSHQVVSNAEPNMAKVGLYPLSKELFSQARLSIGSGLVPRLDGAL